MASRRTILALGFVIISAISIFTYYNGMNTGTFRSILHTELALIRSNITVPMEDTHRGLKPYLQDFKNPCWRENGTLKCLPYFYIPGFMKSGTTSLFNTLVLHDDIVSPVTKEVNGWWNGGTLEKEVEILSQNGVFTEISNSTDVNGYHYKITGDGTPHYIFASIFPKSLYELFRGTRIIIIVRQPTDRFFSHYAHKCRADKSPQDAERLHKAVTEAVKSLKDCMKNTSNSDIDCIKTAEMNSKDNYCGGASIQKSAYIAHIPVWLDSFPRDQILVIQNELLYANPVEEFDKIFSFLGLGKSSEKLHRRIAAFNSKRHNAAPPGNATNILTETKLLLDEFYAPFNLKLAKYLHDKNYSFSLEKWERTELTT